MQINLDDIKVHIKAQDSFLFFCEEILGYKENPAFDYKNLTPAHKELCALMQTNDLAKLILMPRYSFKSGIVTIAYSLWSLVRNPNVRILIYSDSATKAQGFLQGIKNHIEGKAPNSKFRYYYPSWETDPHQGKWSEGQIIISKRDVAYVNPSIDTGGIESSKVGAHCDIIIFDDIVSDINTTTKMQMDKVHDCYKKALSILKPGGKIVITGTRWNYGDTYGRIIFDNKEKGNFKIFIKDAEEKIDGKLIFESIGLTEQFLDYQRKEQGSYIYSSLYRNNPVDDETALFKGSDFQFYEYKPGFHNNFFITGTCDPAGEGEDFTAITVIGTDKQKNMYILDAINEHLKPSEIVDRIIRLNYKWGFNKFAVEKNFFKGMLERDFREVEKAHLSNRNYKPFSFSEDIVASAKQRNFNRILSLQPYHERKQLFFPGKDLNNLIKVYSELAYQMMQFTVDGSKSPHDDLLVSLAFHVELIRPGGDAPKEGPPKTSAAHFEMMQYQEAMALNRALPRQYRKKFNFSLN